MKISSDPASVDRYVEAVLDELRPLVSKWALAMAAEKRTVPDPEELVETLLAHWNARAALL